MIRLTSSANPGGLYNCRMRPTAIELYKVSILTVIAFLLLVIVLRPRHVIVDSGEVEVTNTLQIESASPLAVRADDPLDVNIMELPEPITVTIDK